MSADAIMLHAEDDVATVLRPIAAGETLLISLPDGGQRQMQATQPIPLCHKLALHDIAQATLVRKYGEPIGRTTAAIPQGGHVHVHNLHSERARAG